MKLVPIVVLVSLALAGCASPATPSSAPPSPTGSAPLQPAAATPQGGSPTATTSAAASPAAGAGPAPAPLLVPVSLKGTVPLWAEGCAFTPAIGYCTFEESPATPYSRSFQVLPVTGHVAGGALTLTFSSAEPAPVQMAVTLELAVPGGHWKVLAQKYGDSPVSLPVPTADVGPDEALYVFVNADGQGAFQTAAGAFANPGDVTYDLEGSLTVTGAPTPPTRDVPYSFQGSLPPFVEPCVFPVTCADLPPGSAFKNTDEVHLNAAPVSGSLTMTWTPASPATQTMAFSIAVLGEHDGYTLGYAEGASPLKIDVAKVPLPPGHVLSVHAYLPSNAEAGPAQVAASPAEQDFTVSGAWKVVAT